MGISLKAYFRGLIFVVCPEHIIIVAYCLDFCAEFFVLGLSVTKISRYVVFENVHFYLFSLVCSLVTIIIAFKC